MALYLLSSPEGARCNYFRRILRAGVIKLVLGWPCIQSPAPRAPCVNNMEGYQGQAQLIGLGVVLDLLSSPEGARCNYFARISRAGVIKLVLGWPCIYSPAVRAPGVIILGRMSRAMCN